MNRFLKELRDFAHSFKSLFAFYILMYSVPQIIPFGVVFKVWDKIFITEKDINYVVLATISCYSAVIILLNLFFLIYFTKERTKNPNLYGKGFIGGFDEITETVDSGKSEDLVQEAGDQGGG